jgi:ribose/xylose/arabinose/galactoside ABC-type transport system permease subunit
MADVATLALMYLAVGVGLFAQPDPSTAGVEDFSPLGQARIFRATLPAVLLWPIVLLRRLG